MYGPYTCHSQTCTAYIVGEQDLPHNPQVTAISSAVALRLSIVLSQAILEAIRQEIRPLQQPQALYISIKSTFATTLQQLRAGEVSLEDDPETDESDDLLDSDDGVVAMAEGDSANLNSYTSLETTDVHSRFRRRKASESVRDQVLSALASSGSALRMDMVDPDEEREKAEVAAVLKQNYSRKNKNKEKSFKFRARDGFRSPYQRSVILHRVRTTTLWALSTAVLTA